MKINYILDAQGNPKPEPDLGKWITWFSKLPDDQRQLAAKQIGDVLVSTVFLGIDLNHGRRGPPLIYETMVFGGALDLQIWRWPTRKKALAGHARVAKLVGDPAAIEADIRLAKERMDALLKLFRHG